MRILRAILVRLAVVLFAATVACAAAPAADTPGANIARGVRVGDVVLTGLTAQPARVLLRRELARPLQFALGPRISPARFGLRADVDEAVRLALLADPGDVVPMRVRVDRSAIRDYAAGLARLYGRPAQDALVLELDKALRPVVVPGVYGWRLDRTAVERAIRRALVSGTRERIQLPVVRVRPQVTTRDVGSVIVIKRESKRLLLWRGKQVVRVFKIATGTAVYPTPLGHFAITNKQEHPWWYPPPSDWAEGLKPVPPGPGNPLGTRWMGLSSPSVGIHGTPDAASIGYSASHGCIRMLVSDAEWLFERVRLGTPVFIVGG
ncbi:MAG: L,D-transpeptidase family protein [Gaiellaceae bacterium]